MKINFKAKNNLKRFLGYSETLQWTPSDSPLDPSECHRGRPSLKPPSESPREFTPAGSVLTTPGQDTFAEVSYKREVSAIQMGGVFSTSNHATEGQTWPKYCDTNGSCIATLSEVLRSEVDAILLRYSRSNLFVACRRFGLCMQIFALSAPKPQITMGPNRMDALQKERDFARNSQNHRNCIETEIRTFRLQPFFDTVSGNAAILACGGNLESHSQKSRSVSVHTVDICFTFTRLFRPRVSWR